MLGVRTLHFETLLKQSALVVSAVVTPLYITLGEHTLHCFVIRLRYQTCTITLITFRVIKNTLETIVTP